MIGRTEFNFGIFIEDNDVAFVALAHLATQPVPLLVGCPVARGETVPFRRDPKRDYIDAVIGVTGHVIGGHHAIDIAMPRHREGTGTGLDGRDDLIRDGLMDVPCTGACGGCC